MLQYSDHKVAYLAAASTTYVVASVDIANGTQTIAAQPDYPRTITITVTNTHSDITAGIVTVTGLDLNGQPSVETLDLSSAFTLTGTHIFASVTSVVVTGLLGATAGDTIAVGIGDTCQLTYGRSTLINATVGSGAGTVGKYQFIDNNTGTTTNLAELKAAIAAGTYEWNASVSVGLRVVVTGTTPITVTYAQ